MPHNIRKLTNRLDEGSNILSSNKVGAIKAEIIPENKWIG